MSENQLIGDWSNPIPLTEHDKKNFEDALSGLVGVSYVPHLRSMQVVNGTHYVFFCSATAMTNPQQIGFALAEVHVSTTGSISLTNVTTYGMVPQALGSWTEIRALTELETNIFKKATQGMTGLIHRPYLVSSQAANGTNYRIFCLSTSATLPSKIGISILSIHEDENAENAKVTHFAAFS